MLSASLIIRLPALLLAIVGHEFAHAKMADALGDPTPRRAGRLTLNPLAHLDPVGLLCLWLLGFGWAKPVQVNPFFFRGDRRTGLLLVALAGPLANVGMAFLGLLLLKWSGPALGYGGAILVRTFAWYNVSLAVFNLIPIPPLDGWRILERFAPSRWVEMAERYGWAFLLLLLATGTLGRVLWPLAVALHDLLQTLITWL